MGGVPNAPGPSPTLGSLGPSHQWRHKSRASLRGPPCAHGVAGTPQGEVRDSLGTKKAEDLVYIYKNTRLLRGRLGADPVRWYENNVFSEDEDESVDDNSDTDDGDDDDNLNGGEDIEGNEPINDDERRDDDGRENIVAEDGAGVFDWNEIDAKIEQEN